MKNLSLYLVSIIFLCLPLFTYTQELPAYMTEKEKSLMPQYLQNISSRAYTSPPNGILRNMAEWEEIQALTITWRSYYPELAEIIDAAQEECLVLINCTDSNSVKSSLSSYNVPLTNVIFNIVSSNSVWIRDYGPNSVYINDVDTLIIVDWIYNRPRPQDDAIPASIANYFGLDMYETTTNPWALVHTGGNYFSDGFGTAFSEKLILDENQSLSTAMIDSIMKMFMGIERYIKLTNLPYDGIHHIDMHMKLLDEETLLVGEFPAGTSDGPQIEANLQYILSNYNSVYGTPYKIVRIPMPPSTSGSYAPSAYYRTYSNGVFANKTYLLPTYYQQYDTTAIRILEENMPGYKIIPINSNSIIPASGAIHCITHSVGVPDPLLISHQAYPDTTSNISSYQINAKIMHRSGISQAKVYYRIDTSQTFSSANMTLTDTINHIWTGSIPQQSSGDTIKYYIDATANSGKTLQRPITAPEGFWKFNISTYTFVDENTLPTVLELLPVYPNPASAVTCIPVKTNKTLKASIQLYDIIGNRVENIFEGYLPKGTSNYFIHAHTLPAGIYIVALKTDNNTAKQMLIVR